MRRYAAAFIQKHSKNNVQINIPLDMYELSGFDKFNKFHFSLAVIVDDARAPLLEQRDSISISLIPFPRDIVHRMYYVELDIKSRPSALAGVLACLKKNEINVWDCNSVDTYQGGVAELIVALNEPGEGHGEGEAVLRELLGEVGEPVTVSKAIDDAVLSQIIGAGGSNDFTYKEIEGGRLFERDSNNSKVFLRIPAPVDGSPSKVYADLDKFKTGTYVSLVFDNNAKLLQAFFRDPEEVIVELDVEFVLRRHGQLEGVVSPLGNLAVDFRLIHAKPERSQRPEGGKVRYEMIGNVQHTKLRIFDHATLLAVIKAEIQVSSAEGSATPDIGVKNISSPGGGQVVSILGRSSSLVKNRLAGVELLQNGGDPSERSHVIIYSENDKSGGHIFHLLYDVRHPSVLGLFKFELAKAEQVGLDILDTLHLMCDALSSTLKILKDLPAESIEKKFEAQFLVESSDRLFAALNTTDLIRLCELISKISVSSDNSRLLRDCRTYFQHVKYGMLPFMHNKKYILVRRGRGAQLSYVNLSTTDGAIMLSKVEEFVGVLEVAARAISEKKEFNAGDVARHAQELGVLLVNGKEEGMPE